VLLLPPPHLVLPPHTKSSPRQARCLVRALGHPNPGSHRLQPPLQRAQRLPHTAEVPAPERPQKALEHHRPDFNLHTPVYSWQCFGVAATKQLQPRSGRQCLAPATGEEIPPHASPSRGDPEAQSRRPQAVDAGETGGKVRVLAVLRQPVLLFAGDQRAEGQGVGGDQAQVGTQKDRGQRGQADEEGALGQGRLKLGREERA
jgi:hypothetical protein